MNKNFATAAIVLAILFGAAFQCGKEDGGIDSDKNNADSGGLTEEIVKQKITESVESSVLGVTGPKSVDLDFK